MSVTHTEEPALAATGETPEIADRPTTPRPGTGRQRLEELLPQIKDLALKVGGYRELARIVESLDEVKE